jgi:HK97 family phage prohead protease
MGQRTLLFEWGGTKIYEEIAPGAFDNVLNNDVRCLFNHDSSNLLGRTTSGTLRLSVQGNELRYDNDLPDTQVAKDVHNLIARGDISGCSFAFNIKSETRTELEGGDVLYTVNEVSALYDVGPVTYPAYPEGTSVSARDRESIIEEIKNRKQEVKPKRSMKQIENLLKLIDPQVKTNK